VLPSLLTPKSRGFIRLKTADPYDHPLIEPNYLSNPYDIQLLVCPPRVNVWSG